MRKINTVKELVDFAYNRYKTKKAITIESDYIKNINYFNFRFDIYSMARVIKSKENQIRNNKIAIISEFRYEFLVTYLANIMVNNAVILIDNKLSKNTIEKSFSFLEYIFCFSLHGSKRTSFLFYAASFICP